jgi:glycosyltransferase involved in cell wall biosynthesis
MVEKEDKQDPWMTNSFPAHERPEMPELTIGLAVYNGSAGLTAALDSLLAQTFTGFTLHISDNASTDSTQKICEEAAARDSRIVYTRQKENIGGFLNFRFLLEQAKTPYFMWAAHDDSWSPTFVEKNLFQLKANSKANASISKIVFHHQGVPVRHSNSTYALEGSCAENLHRFLVNPGDNSRFYGVHQTESLKRSFPNCSPFHCFDWLIVALTLREGHYLEWPEVLMSRSIANPNRYAKQVRNDNSSWLTRLFPALPFTIRLIRCLGLRYLPSIAFDLVQINVLQHSNYIRYYYPKWHSMEERLYRQSGFRTLLKRFMAP